MSKDTTDDETLRRELHRLIIENRDGTGAIDASDQSAMADEIMGLISRHVQAALLQHRSFNLDINASDDYKNGFQDALDQFSKALELQAQPLTDRDSV